MLLWGFFWEVEGVVLCGLVSLYGGELDGRRGSPAPLLQLPVLKEEVYGREGDA